MSCQKIHTKKFNYNAAVFSMFVRFSIYLSLSRTIVAVVGCIVVSRWLLNVVLLNWSNCYQKRLQEIFTLFLKFWKSSQKNQTSTFFQFLRISHNHHTFKNDNDFFYYSKAHYYYTDLYIFKLLKNLSILIVIKYCIFSKNINLF